jgi:hypothetical protein
MWRGCRVRRAEGRLAVLDSGGGGIHFPTPTGLMIIEAHLELAVWHLRKERASSPMPSALRLFERRETRGILEVSLRAPES